MAKDLKALAAALTDKEFTELLAQRCVHEARNECNNEDAIVHDYAMWILSEAWVGDAAKRVTELLKEPA